jgi:hypothetical protein
MSDWLVLSQTITSTGNAREFTAGWGAIWGTDYHQPLFMIAAERHGGGDDSRIPRRCIGIGADPRSARASLEETITACDPSGRVVFSL